MKSLLFPPMRINHKIEFRREKKGIKVDYFYFEKKKIPAHLTRLKKTSIKDHLTTQYSQQTSL